MAATHSTRARNANHTLLWLTGAALTAALIGHALLLIPAARTGPDALIVAFGVWLLTLPTFALCVCLFRTLLTRRERLS